MEAKDTVMNERQLAEIFPATGEEIREHQAEISFKAGQESVLAEAKAGNVSVNDLIRAAKQAGIREVVEWIKAHEVKSYVATPSGVYLVDIGMLDGWQAKLKEWEV